ncbi:hypothetical protein K457DRAFT_133448 [Linnemannia elongata AG-77]|uniref:Uncharacterized protein n=1 Tax=Linnemannia elongata AG-77 TaxID=1314771 RepID=A0A197K9P1_9FUNG|nr:hypothetical protein K457DRAFT_133448 [Linnemannia elongata AG-77]
MVFVKMRAFVVCDAGCCCLCCGVCSCMRDLSDYDLERTRIGIGAFEVNAIDRYGLTKKEEEGCGVCKRRKKDRRKGRKGEEDVDKGKDWGLDWKGKGDS